MAVAYRHVLYNSVDDVPRDPWDAVVGRPTFASDARLVRCLEQTLADQCKCWTLLIHDEPGRAVGGARLCRFTVDALDSTHPTARRMAAGVRRIWNGCGRFNVLFCGLPVPAGASHLWIAPNVEPAPVIESLHAAMTLLARSERARLTVVKELSGAECASLERLGTMGYVRGGIPPLHALGGGYANFDDYCAALKARYRSQVNRSRKKLRAAGCHVEHVSGAAAVVERYTDDVHRLYAAVWERSSYRLEFLPAEFVRELARQFDRDVSLTLISDAEKIVAFTLGLTSGDTYYNLYSGLDYARNAEADLYFNLFYEDLDYALRRGCAHVHLGQTSDDFKSRLGTTAEPRYFLVRAANPLLHAGLRRAAKWVFPPVPTPTPHDVFAAPPSPNKSRERRSAESDLAADERR